MLSHYPPNDVEENRRPAPRGSTFVVSRERFDDIPACRGRYILLFLLITLMHIVPKVVFIVTKVDPPHEFAPIFYAVLIGLIVPFCFYFSKAMHTLGYPIFQILLTQIVTLTPILGLLPMGYMDRKIADAWDKVDGEHKRYRQRIVEDEDGETE